MAYKGYLLKVGVGNANPYVITGQRYINYKSYEVTKEVQDMDSYRDATGVLHRNALSHVPIKVTFETLPNLTNADIKTFFIDGISANYHTPLERKAMIEVYVPELDDYISQDMYMAGPTLKIRSIDLKTNVIHYESIKVSFIGY